MKASPPTPEQLLALIQRAIFEAPFFLNGQKLKQEDYRWLGRADALLEASGPASALIAFRAARDNINGLMHSRDRLLIPLHDAYGRLELLVPSASHGAFIPGGDTWDGYAALVRVFQKECDDLLVVDRYLNATLFTELAPHAVARKGIRCLTSKRAENHPGLLAAATKWSGDSSVNTRPIEVRYVPPLALHDRLLILDSAQTWLVSQSFKDIAKTSPASVVHAEDELGHSKAQHYDGLWSQAMPMA